VVATQMSCALSSRPIHSSSAAASRDKMAATLVGSAGDVRTFHCYIIRRPLSCGFAETHACGVILRDKPETNLPPVNEDKTRVWRRRVGTASTRLLLQVPMP